ncbi:MAG: TonB-dependent receptor, partial [Lewinella sp.]|nr:TonB-dependent receptor [Lewinella sp.]
QIRNLSAYLYGTDLFPQSKLSSHGIYLQNQLQYGKWQLLLSLRREFFNDIVNFRLADEETVSQTAWLPRAGLVYTLNPNINLYGTYVQGYQPQTASVINDPNAGGPFAPLESQLLEIGAKTEWLEGRLGISLAIYNLTQTGTLFPANDPAFPDLLRQIGEERSRGFEFDLTGRLSANWSLVMSYAYTDAEITASNDVAEIGRQKPNAPAHTGNVWTKYVINKGPSMAWALAQGPTSPPAAWAPSSLLAPNPPFSLATNWSTSPFTTKCAKYSCSSISTMFLIKPTGWEGMTSSGLFLAAHGLF